MCSWEAEPNFADLDGLHILNFDSTLTIIVEKYDFKLEFFN